MDILKRSLAPITDDMWAEIDAQAQQAIVSSLTARKVVDVLGPKGWNYAAVEIGRLVTVDIQPEAEVKYGLYSVQPLMETRISCELEREELESISRGAKDIDLDKLIDAAQKIALFEENTIYHGIEKGAIAGMLPSAKQQPVDLFETPPDFLKGIASGITTLTREAIGGPYALIINPNVWNSLISNAEGYPFEQRVEHLIEGPVIPCAVVEGGILVSVRGGDFELTLGHDFSIGYEGHDDKYVNLFLTESFTFRVLEPNALIPLQGRTS